MELNKRDDEGISCHGYPMYQQIATYSSASGGDPVPIRMARLSCVAGTALPDTERAMSSTLRIIWQSWLRRVGAKNLKPQILDSRLLSSHADVYYYSGYTSVSQPGVRAPPGVRE
jgi:hypothetical protein